MLFLELMTPGKTYLLTQVVILVVTLLLTLVCRPEPGDKHEKVLH